ncbi:hypothetical protein VM1G_07749 [Cytospora mali]|uniref:Uncharacterized protein n=1 Tax=Cytospora mali TaxID=578113 RepID=A0A194W718_CYTMA|nr:hypothetical protein VM1G_07749 [Valsa mali]
MGYHNLKMKLVAKLTAKGAGTSNSTRTEPRFLFEEDDDNDTDFFKPSDYHATMLRKRMIDNTAATQSKRVGRFVNEDPNANKLFENVAGYKESLKKYKLYNQQDKPSRYIYPPEQSVMGPGWCGQPRDPGEDSAADKLFKDVDKEKYAQEKANEEARNEQAARMAEQAMQNALLTMSRLSERRTVRYEGEDPNAEALFEDVPRFKQDLRPAKEAPKKVGSRDL